MVAIVLFLGIALYASSTGVSCQGTVKDQYDSPVEGVWNSKHCQQRIERQNGYGWLLLSVRLTAKLNS